MSYEISKTEFKARALELLREVEATGDTLIVTDHGKPAVEVRRYRAPVRRDPLQALRGSVLWYHDPYEPVDADWEASP